MLFFYFKFVITSRFISTSYVFFYRNLIKRKSKLNILFINKKCNAKHIKLNVVCIKVAPINNFLFNSDSFVFSFSNCSRYPKTGIGAEYIEIYSIAFIKNPFFMNKRASPSPVAPPT